MTIYELYGRQAEKLAELAEYHKVTQEVLTSLKEGKVLPSQLVVTREGWTVQDAPMVEVSTDAAS